MEFRSIPQRQIYRAYSPHADGVVPIDRKRYSVTYLISCAHESCFAYSADHAYGLNGYSIGMDVPCQFVSTGMSIPYGFDHAYWRREPYHDPADYHES